MTRAEEALFVGGALGLREKVPAPNSWYARLAELFANEGPIEDPLWQYRFEHGALASLPPKDEAGEEARGPAVPDWLRRPVAAEPRPPRPLAPSSLGEDVSPDPPLAPGAGMEAAQRGVLIHKLLERLPGVAVEAREEAARRWLGRNAPVLDTGARDELAQAVLTVLAEPAWADIFTVEALAEVPIAAVVGGQVVAGTIDRLVIGPERIRLVDFKTTRRPPGDAGEVPPSTVRQIAAYVAALETTYPGRRVEAGVLYTQTPRLIELGADVLARYKAALFAAQ
jgi:ATP-dependent helicase/nuclease subunit A